MFRSRNQIYRNYKKPLFRKQKNTGRYVFMLALLALIVGIPVVAWWQFDAVQLSALDAIGYAPTATPFASERANRAQQLYDLGDVQAAALLYEMAVTAQPENPSYLYEFGMTLVEQDELTRAAQLGERLIEIAPDDPRGYALKANATMWTDPVEAVPAAIIGTELGTPFAPLNAALAIAYTQIGRYAEAVQNGDLAIRINPMDANARRAYSYPLILTGRYNEAIEQLQRAIEINPNLTAPYFELAALYRRINDEEMAVGIYERIIQQEPDNERAYLRVCETYASVGLFQDAEAFCDRALEIDPNYASAHRMRGQLRYSRRNYEGAIDSFETCKALGSDEIECDYLRGWAKYLLGQCDEAWTILNDSLQLARREPVIETINIGLTNITIRCAGYANRSLPTPIPPTPIPPTPIGGF
jgi:tetratricopeptide (TPR) repeat protein